MPLIWPVYLLTSTGELSLSQSAPPTTAKRTTTTTAATATATTTTATPAPVDITKTLANVPPTSGIVNVSCDDSLLTGKGMVYNYY